MYEMHQQRIQPDLVTYNTLLAVYARALAPAKRQAKPGEWDVPEGHADGKQLLKPLQTNPIPNKPKIGSGLVLVQEGNETVSASTRTSSIMAYLGLDRYAGGVDWAVVARVALLMFVSCCAVECRTGYGQ